MTNYKYQEERILSAERQGDDDHLQAHQNGANSGEVDHALRPQSLSSFIGQKHVKENLKVFVEAAKTRDQAMDHILFYGPPGLGKTTLAQIMSKELGVGFRATSGPVIAKAGDLAAILSNLQPRDVLFIDEIHRLNPAVEEILYPAMEDYQLDLMIGEGPAARSVRIDLNPFTLVGATTRAGRITTPLRERFGIPLHMQFYEVDELNEIIERAARLLGLAISKEGAGEIAKRSRGTPRIANRLLRRVRDFATVDGDELVTRETADKALWRLNVDSRGLDAIDRSYMGLIAEHYGGGPVGVETLSAALGNERDVVEEVVEPFLIQIGMVQRTPRGRILTKTGWDYLGLNAPESKSNFTKENDHPKLFDD